MHYPETMPMENFEASYMISNGFDQSMAEMIGTKIRFSLRFSQALRHPLSKLKGTPLAKKLVKDLAIMLKSLINLQ